MSHELKCPECGNVSEFTADAVVLSNAVVRITPDGIDYSEVGCGLNAEVPEWASVTCRECGHVAELPQLASVAEPTRLDMRGEEPGGELVLEYEDYLYDNFAKWIDDRSNPNMHDVYDFIASMDVVLFTGEESNAVRQFVKSCGLDPLEAVRCMMPTGDGFVMAHGHGYDWKSSDLLGGSADGRAWREFEEWCGKHGYVVS